MKGNESNHLATSAIKMINTEYYNCVLFYTDGSIMMKDKQSGAGCCITHLNKKFYIPTNSSSVHTELLAINATVSCITLAPKTYFAWFKISSTKSTMLQTHTLLLQNKRYMHSTRPDQRSSLRAESARVSVQTTSLCLVSKPALEAHRWNG